MERAITLMIQLDTSFLIRGLVAGTREATTLAKWLSDGEKMNTSAIAWMEFITGPVSAPLVAAARQIIEDRILPIDAEDAELAATLFNSIGRKRALRYDCLIASSAIGSRAKLATANHKDFEAFVSFGLKLA